MKKANVSLTTVLICSAILLLSGITILLISMDLSRLTKDNLNNELSEMRNLTCIEEALNRIKKDINYTGMFSVTFNDGMCEGNVTIHSTITYLRNIVINSEVNSYYSTIEKVVDTSTSPFSIRNK